MNLTSTKDKDGQDTTFINRHFFNRLFDRDTLILKEYNINFLFVLSTYVLNIESASRKEQIQSIFREDLIRALNDRYDFYQIEPQAGKTIESLVKLVEQNFRKFMGRMYCGKDLTLWVALERDNYKDIVDEKEKETIYPDIGDFIGNIKVKEVVLKTDGKHITTREYTQCIRRAYEYSDN